jgi:hypothetical protein
MHQYYVLNRDPRSEAVFDFIEHYKLECQVHLNRTRFWVPAETSVYTEFLLRFSDCCHLVDPTLDPATGLPQ